MQCKQTTRVTRRAVLGLMAGLAFSAFFTDPQSAFAKPSGSRQPQVIMEVEKRGKITIELEPQAAPKTVAHFLDLVHKKFYDGILFHRLVPNFVAQAGDPGSKNVKGAQIADMDPGEVAQQFHLGNGGSGKNVPLEAKLPHERGTLGLARSADPGSGDSQFFFNLKANHDLDAGYCVFGKVTQGLDVMDKIRQGDRIKSIYVVGKSKK